VRRVVIVLLVFLAACSSQSSEGVPAEDAVDTTDTTPETTKKVAADLIAAVDEGKAACAEDEQARAAYADGDDDFFGSFEALENIGKSSDRLDKAITRIEAIDSSVIPIEELQRWYEALQANEGGDIESLPDLLLEFGAVFLLVCDRISQYR
jgi:hypothetical protein